MIALLIFINKVMSRVYSLIFNTILPRVLDEMRIYIQPNLENRVGDSVLFMHSTVIWVYGCHEFPYLLPIFLTPIFFSLEFIGKRIISQIEHILKLHKDSNLKFPFIIVPFIVKARYCLSQIQAKLKDFGFSKLQGIIYDPHQIISKRILMKKYAPYEHGHVEGFDKLENLEVCVDMEIVLNQLKSSKWR
jgi:hypothetical protein